MSELFFVLKMFIFSIGLIVLMQIKVGSMSLEERTYILLQSSMVTPALQKVADGGVLLYKKGELLVTRIYDGHFATQAHRRKASDKVNNLKWGLRREAARNHEPLTQQRERDETPLLEQDQMRFNDPGDE